MSLWFAGSLGLLVALVPTGIVCFKRDAMDRLAGLEMATVLGALALMTIAQGLHQPSFYDLALALALLSLGGSLVFVRFLERWL